MPFPEASTIPIVKDSWGHCHRVCPLVGVALTLESVRELSAALTWCLSFSAFSLAEGPCVYP